MPKNTITRGVAYADQDNLGTTSNDSAAQGYVGEFVSATIASAGALSLTTATAKTIASITLTPGDWDISGAVDFVPAATTNVTQWNAAVSLTTNTLSTQAGGSGLGTDPITTVNQAASVPAAQVNWDVGPVRLQIAATTTVYLVAQATFTVSTMTAYGTIRARRMW